MSRRTTIVLECNGCKTRRQGRVGEVIGSLRQRLLEIGWFVDDAANEDFCPSCAERLAPL